jgi:uncharacterized protein YceH (UPF0502 family)
MAHDTKRNIEGILNSAKQKAEQTRKRAEEAITLLIREQRLVNFKAVAETAQISTAWLYANEEIKMRIIHLRSQQVPKAQVKIPSREQASTASKDAMIAALQKRVREQATEIQELKKQLEAAYGPLYKQ